MYDISAKELSYQSGVAHELSPKSNVLTYE